MQRSSTGARECADRHRHGSKSSPSPAPRICTRPLPGSRAACSQRAPASPVCLAGAPAAALAPCAPPAPAATAGGPPVHAEKAAGRFRGVRTIRRILHAGGPALRHGVRGNPQVHHGANSVPAGYSFEPPAQCVKGGPQVSPVAAHRLQAWPRSAPPPPGHTWSTLGAAGLSPMRQRQACSTRLGNCIFLMLTPRGNVQESTTAQRRTGSSTGTSRGGSTAAAAAAAASSIFRVLQT